MLRNCAFRFVETPKKSEFCFTITVTVCRGRRPTEKFGCSTEPTRNTYRYPSMTYKPGCPRPHYTSGTVPMQASSSIRSTTSRSNTSWSNKQTRSHLRTPIAERLRRISRRAAPYKLDHRHRHHFNRLKIAYNSPLAQPIKFYQWIPIYQPICSHHA